MFIYWSSCFISCVLMKLAAIKKTVITTKDKRFRNTMMVLSALPMILVAALRYDVGRDYMYTYVPYFYRVTGFRTYDKLEPLYHQLNVIVHRFSDDYVWVFAVCAVIFVLLIYISIIEESPYPELSVFLLIGTTYYFIFLNTMRQMVGVAICFFALKYVKKQKLLPFLVCIALACSFHYSCVLFVAMYFIGRYKFNIKTIAIVTVIVALVASVLANKINGIIINTVYSEYLGSRFDRGEQGFVVLSMNILLLIFAAVMRKKDEKYQIYLNLQLIATWIAILTGRIVLFNRIRWMFGLPVIVLIPMAISNIEKKEFRICAYAVVVLLYLIYAQYTIGLKNGNSVLPYQTIFDRP